MILLSVPSGFDTQMRRLGIMKCFKIIISLLWPQRRGRELKITASSTFSSTGSSTSDKDNKHDEAPPNYEHATANTRSFGRIEKTTMNNAIDLLRVSIMNSTKRNRKEG